MIALVLCGVLLVAQVVYLTLRERVPEGSLEDVSAEHRWMPASPSDRWTCIILHHSAGESGSADQFDEWHRQKGWDELGYHFVIGNGTHTAAGQVEIGSRWISQKHGAHTRTDDDYYNQHGIGICLVGNFDLHAPDDRQMQSLTRLVAFLCQTFHIAPQDIYTHGGVTQKTNCPGKLFDVEKVRQAVAATQPAAVGK